MDTHDGYGTRCNPCNDAHAFVQTERGKLAIKNRKADILREGQLRHNSILNYIEQRTGYRPSEDKDFFPRAKGIWVSWGFVWSWVDSLLVKKGYELR